MCDLFGCSRANLVEDNISSKSVSLEIDSITASKGKYFGLKVKCNSMEPRICEGDILIVKRQDDCESGDIPIVIVNGNDATIKRLMKYADGIRADELENAGADYILENVEDILPFLNQM